MFRTKLLILLLTSLVISSCIKKDETVNNYQYSIGYIGGEYDGLILKNLFSTHLRSFNLYSSESNYEIITNVSHSKSLFITNINNTSDRESINSSINVKVFNKRDKCVAHTFQDEVKQFFIYASGDKFISNQKALEKIKFDNTNALIKNFINDISNIKHNCDEK